MRSRNAALQNGNWIYHSRPESAVVTSVPGIVLSCHRIFFLLEDGRLGELHISGLGGADVSPLSRPASGKKHCTDYVWSVYDAPESEGGNADYCTASLGPSNCLEGIDDGSGFLSEQQQESFELTTVNEPSRAWTETTSSLFRARSLNFGKSIFLIGQDGIPSERFFNNNVWLWLKHDFVSPIRGVLGIYNGSVFMNDADGNLLIREWNGSSLQWLNCTALEGGSKVTSGSPWDGMLGEVRTVTLEDAQFFVAESGDLMELQVALRRFSWRNCGRPPDTFAAVIVDQEVFRYRVVFVVGSNGKLYHFNRITRHWYSYHQPDQLDLSRIPGTVYRPSFQSTSGSLFMRSEVGSLVELRWDVNRGWIWSDHGIPTKEAYLATSPGPCMENGNVLIVGSDGRVHARKLVDGKWKWQDLGHPLHEQTLAGNSKKVFVLEDRSKDGDHADLFLSFEGDCDGLIDSVRPVAVNKDVAAFVLRDGRLAELKQEEDRWEWISIIDTPTSSCHSSYWTAEQIT